MSIRSVLKQIRELFTGTAATHDEPQMIAAGWDRYAEAWRPDKFNVVPEAPVVHLGDEWTGEDVSGGGTTYGLPLEVVSDFSRFLEEQLLSPHLPGSNLVGMEIGPGGGRMTELLLKRSSRIHAVDASKAMLAALKKRFGSDPRVAYHLSDGMTLPPLGAGSLDYVAAFDVFVHFEPRLVYWYVQQVARLLKPNGIGIIHYANLLTPLGGKQFLGDVERNVRRREAYFSFGVMTPELMGRFLEFTGMTPVSTDIGIIPRDAVAVFRKPA